jgi:hypothetical protein
LTVHFIAHGGKACPEDRLGEYLALAAKGRESVAKLAALFNEMAALDEATALTPHQVRDLTALDVPIRERILPPTPFVVELPSLPDGRVSFAVTPDPAALARFRADLADIGERGLDGNFRAADG